jgi:ribonuclease R
MNQKRWNPPGREEILEVLRAAPLPLTPLQLGEHYRLAGEQFEVLNRRVNAMERDGQLLPNRKGVLLLASKLELVAGRVQGHRDGFGFLIPDHGGQDLFLSNREMQKVMHGDRVLVKHVGEDSRGRPEGRIIEVTERINRKIVGRFLNERGITIVAPEDQRIKHDILIAPGDGGGAEHGQVVSCEITDPPSGHNQPLGRVVEVLGGIDDPGMEIEIAVRKFNVPHEFSESAKSEAEKFTTVLKPGDLKHRVDLRDVSFVTIDGEDARDFDDAVYCEPILTKKGRSGGYRLLVAIADVAHYVQLGSAIDDDAGARSTSVYFPRRVIPMLPEVLSNGLCSLNPQVDRLVLVCDMVIDSDGHTAAYQFYEAVIYSAARLTYNQVWAVLSNDPAAPKLPEIKPHLFHLHDLFSVLSKARERRGALDFDTIETKIVCDQAGRIEKIIPSKRNDAHKLIEEAMLAANVCAADFLHRSEHPGLYRVHEGPTPEKLVKLRTFLKSLGLSLGGGDDPTPLDYARLTEPVRARPDASLIQTMMLRSMQQAIYTPDNSGHFGLAYAHYAHFTSPIRRYPDLLTHRAIKAILHGRKYHPTDPSLAEAQRAPAPSKGHNLDAWRAWGVQCSGHERRADEASRDVEAWLKCQFMRERVGEQYAGKVTGVAAFGLFVTLDQLYVEGLVHVSELGSEYFQFSDTSHELRGERTGQRYRLTDPIEVQVQRVDLETRRIEFRLVQRATQKGVIQAVTREAAREQGFANARAGLKAGPKAGVKPSLKAAAKPKPETLHEASSLDGSSVPGRLAGQTGGKLTSIIGAIASAESSAKSKKPRVGNAVSKAVLKVSSKATPKGLSNGPSKSAKRRRKK